MKKFRKFFFGRIQSDGTEIKESIAKYFFEAFKQLFFFKPILPVNKSIIVLLEENSNLIETYFFGGMEKTL